MDEQNEILVDYAVTFSTVSGRKVLEDLQQAFHERESEELEAEVSAIPHPYRAYYIEGQRSVIKAIQQAMALGFQIQQQQEDAT